MSQLFNVEKGMGLNLVMLYKNPGKMVRDIAEGRTMPYTNIFRMTIVILALCTLALVGSGNYEAQQAVVGQAIVADAESLERQMRGQRFIKDYLNVLFLVLIPLMALGNYWITRHRGLNYAEHLMVAAVQFVGSMLMSTVIQIAAYLLFGVSLGMAGFVFVLSFLYYAYVLWSVFPTMRWYGALWRSFVGYTIAFLLLIVVCMIGMAVFMLGYATLFGKEALETIFAAQ